MFSNIHDAPYWTGTELPGTGLPKAFDFDVNHGDQNTANQSLLTRHVWAVAPGDHGGATTVVPLPGTVWLFCSALVGLLGLRRRYLGV
jgi:hypothetical protein